MFTFSAVEIGNSLQEGLDKIFAFLPNLIGALIILVVGYVVARVIRKIVGRLLAKSGLDETLSSGKAGPQIAKASTSVSASKVVAGVIFWVLFLGTLSLAAAALQIAALTDLISAIYAYLPNVLAAAVIFVVASVIAAAVGGLVSTTMGETPTGKIIGSVVPVLVMAIAVFMILNQLQIAPEIVTITYTALLGSAALGLALAFGLGGRDTAAKMVADAYQKGQESRASGAPTGRFARDDKTRTEATTESRVAH